MPSKRDVLAILSRDELLAVVDRFELAPPDRRAKDGLIETIAGSKKATLAQVLTELSRDRLKELCRALGLDDSGREKSLLVDRLAGAKLRVVSPVRPGKAGLKGMRCDELIKFRESSSGCEPRPAKGRARPAGSEACAGRRKAFGDA